MENAKESSDMGDKAPEGKNIGKNTERKKSEEPISNTQPNQEPTTENQESLQSKDKPTSSTQDEDPSSKTSDLPKGVNPAMWEKFQALKSKREMISKGAAEKRKRRDEWKAAKRREKQLASTQTSEVGPSANDPSNASASISTASQNEEWDGVKKFIGCNDHLKGINRGIHAPKSGIEEKIDSAIKHGDFEAAEELSDHLAVRQFGERVTEAIDAKKYSEAKAKEEAEKKAKRQKKLNWGFEHKERWETKGNM